MKIIKVLAVAAVLSGCAETYLLEEEAVVLRTRPVTSETNLAVLSTHSGQLTTAYMNAARKASAGQDAAAVVTYLAAAVFVAGAVGSASDTALANAGLIGAGAASVAGRTLSQKTIKGIYAAAKQMNCVSTNAKIGSFLLDGTAPGIKGIARAATYGAVQEVKITTRQALVREDVDFVQIRDGLFAGIEAPDGIRELGGPERRFDDSDIALLNQYLQLLENCLGAEKDVTAVEPIPDD